MPPAPSARLAVGFPAPREIELDSAWVSGKLPASRVRRRRVECRRLRSPLRERTLQNYERNPHSDVVRAWLGRLAHG